MGKIQINLDDKTDKNIQIYMAYNNLENKSKTINIILEEFFSQKNNK